MSKATLGQKGLGLTYRLFVASGLILSFSQTANESSKAERSHAQLRQQAWTQDVFSGNLLEGRGTGQDILNRHGSDPVVTGSVAAMHSSLSAMQGPQIQMASIQKAGGHVRSAKRSAQALVQSDAGLGMTINRKGKSDRRVGWAWEPYDVRHGRRAVAMNWSGSMWTMAGPFTALNQNDLPKTAFTQDRPRKMSLADAQVFLMPKPVHHQPATMMAKATGATGPAHGINGAGYGIEPGAQAATNQVGATTLAYAPTSAEALQAPFNAILTEQQTGQISEDNQVTILGAVEALNRDSALSSSAKIVPPIAALPRVKRAPKSKAAAVAPASLASKTTGKAKLQTASLKTPVPTKPLDMSKTVDLTGSKKKANGPSKKVGLTMARSQARRAEIRLASVSGKSDNKDRKKSRFARWFSFGGSAKKAKIVTKGEHAWVKNKLPKSSYSSKQKKCLANAIYFESRSEPQDGQIAVAQVVVNRVKNPAYPNTICGVVYQNKHKRNACQFSFACDRIADRVRDKKSWATATKLANKVINGEVWLKSVGSSTHYHATYVRPKWANTMKRRKKIGLHIFYKTYGGGWS